VSYVHVDEFGSQFVRLGLVNSSLQTSVPDAMFGLKLCEATVLFEYPDAAARALTVRFDETRKGA
jgi:hypothetical protein